MKVLAVVYERRATGGWQRVTTYEPHGSCTAARDVQYMPEGFEP